MRELLRYPVLFFGVLLLGCGMEFDSPDAESTNGGDEQEVLQTGIASWYGPGFHGRLTSNRERYNQDELTAAHRTLPFDTVVEVVNVDNDKTVEVRINDRGPYARGRIIDLSKAAADTIGMVHSGVANVELLLVEAGGTIPEDLNRPTYTLQIGEYFSSFFAERFLDDVGEGGRIEQDFIPGTDRTRYRIYYGNYNRIDSARVDLEKLKERGFDGFVKQVD